jgi:hypothetical protein
MFEFNNIATIEIPENSVVVTSDKQSAAPIKTDNAGVNAALFTLTQMANERELWEVNEYAASRKRLYQLLTQCYEYYITMKLGTNKAIRGEYKKALNDFCEQRGYNFKKTTHDMNVVVSAVFNGSTRSRVSAYAQALRVALVSGGTDDNGQPRALLAVDLASWIEAAGGVEEIRTGRKNTGMTATARAKAAAQQLDEKPALGHFPADFKTYGLDTNDCDKQMVLVVTFRNTGQFEINALVKDNSAVREALVCYHKANKSQDSGSNSSSRSNQSSLKPAVTA